MAKVVFKRTPHSAYEWAEVEGGDTMKDYERSALLDDFIAKNGLVPVESVFHGEVPTHKYGRYIAGDAAPSALPPPALPGREDDLIKANAKNTALEQEIARLTAQLGKQPEAAKAEVVEALPIVAVPAMVGTSSGGGQTTEDARATLNQQDGVNIVPSNEEVREDSSTADRSDDNPKVDDASTAEKKPRGRKPKAD